MIAGNFYDLNTSYGKKSHVCANINTLEACPFGSLGESKN